MYPFITQLLSTFYFKFSCLFVYRQWLRIYIFFLFYMYVYRNIYVCMINVCWCLCMRLFYLLLFVVDIVVCMFVCFFFSSCCQFNLIYCKFSIQVVNWNVNNCNELQFNMFLLDHTSKKINSSKIKKKNIEIKNWLSRQFVVCG